MNAEAATNIILIHVCMLAGASVVSIFRNNNQDLLVGKVTEKPVNCKFKYSSHFQLQWFS